MGVGGGGEQGVQCRAEHRLVRGAMPPDRSPNSVCVQEHSSAQSTQPYSEKREVKSACFGCVCVCVDEAHTQTNQPTNTDRQHTAVHSLKGIEDSLVLNVERVEECEDSLATTAADETQQHTTQ